MSDVDDQQATEIAKRKKEQETLFKDFQRVFDSEPGRRVFKHLFKRFFVSNTVDLTNSHLTYFNEGQREVIRYFLEILRMDVDQVFNQVDPQQT